MSIKQREMFSINSAGIGHMSVCLNQKEIFLLPWCPNRSPRAPYCISPGPLQAVAYFTLPSCVLKPVKENIL